MKRLFPLLSLFLLTTMACSDEESSGPGGTKGGGRQIELSEQLSDGDGSTLRTETYTYDENGRLQTYVARQIFLMRGEPIDTIESVSTVQYEAERITVRDEYDNRSVYLLDEKGYATECLTEEGGGNTRRYQFAYADIATDGKRYLKEVTEHLEIAGLTEPIEDPYSLVSIDYNDMQQPVILQQTSGVARSFILTLPAGGTANTACLPCLFLTEQHPLELHNVALYGGWLGDAYDVLAESVQPAGNDNESVTYTYSTDEQGNLTACDIITHSYGRNYRRSIRYQIFTP